MASQILLLPELRMVLDLPALHEHAKAESDGAMAQADESGKAKKGPGAEQEGRRKLEEDIESIRQVFLSCAAPAWRFDALSRLSAAARMALGDAEAEALPAKSAPVDEKVDHPKHYNSSPSGVEAIRVVEWMTFNLGNAVKYLWRAGQKPGVSTIEDLKKSVWYIQREIGRIERMAIGDAQSVAEKTADKEQRGKPFQRCSAPFITTCAEDGRHWNEERFCERPKGHDGAHAGSRAVPV